MKKVYEETKTTQDKTRYVEVRAYMPTGEDHWILPSIIRVDYGVIEADGVNKNTDHILMVFEDLFTSGLQRQAIKVLDERFEQLDREAKMCLDHEILDLRYLRTPTERGAGSEI